MSDTEIVDIVDEQGNVIGNRVRSECHRNKSLIHPAVHFTLYDAKTKRVLMTKRSTTKKFDGGKSCFLGEHVLSGESLTDAVARGFQEELGFEGEEFHELDTHIFRFESQTEYTKFYIALWKGEELHPDRNESEKEWWMNFDELRMLNENVGDITRFWIEKIDWNILENKFS